MTKEEFEKVKPELFVLFQEAIHKTLVEMGDDIKGITWFCSRAEEYNENRTV